MRLFNMTFSKTCHQSNLSTKSTESLKKTRASYYAILIGVAAAGVLFMIIAFWKSAPEILFSSLGIFASLLPIYIDGIEKINRELRERE
ncbi:MAG: hypothetical protein NW226_02955 [Microscillaceae bacterium]|nr:hypothetical protein [Microscillaceae bacterium]